METYLKQKNALLVYFREVRHSAPCWHQCQPFHIPQQKSVPVLNSKGGFTERSPSLQKHLYLFLVRLKVKVSDVGKTEKSGLLFNSSPSYICVGGTRDACRR